MIIELKSLLKSKISIYCFLVLLSLNIFSLWSLEKSNATVETKDAYISEYENKNESINIDLLTLNNALKMVPLDSTKSLIDIYHTEANINQTFLDNARQANSIREVKQLDLIAELQKELISLNMYADKQTLLPFQEVFDKELIKYQELIDVERWEVDTLTLDALRELQSNQELSYWNSYQRIVYYFDMLQSNTIELTPNYASPWSLLANQLAFQPWIEQIIVIIGILYVMSRIITLKNDGIFRLLCVQPIQSKRLVWRECLVIFIGYSSILLLSFMIPFCISGILHSFADHTMPVFTYVNGLTSFQGYQHDAMFNQIGLSYIPSSINTGYSDMLIPAGLTLMSVLQVLGFTCFLLFLKVFTCIIATYTLCIWMKRTSGIMISCSIVVGIFFLSQVSHFLSGINPFGIGSSYLIVEGSADITFLHSCILLLVCCLICVAFHMIASKKMRIE